MRLLLYTTWQFFAKLLKVTILGSQKQNSIACFAELFLSEIIRMSFRRVSTDEEELASNHQPCHKHYIVIRFYRSTVIDRCMCYLVLLKFWEKNSSSLSNCSTTSYN